MDFRRLEMCFIMGTMALTLVGKSELGPSVDWMLFLALLAEFARSKPVAAGAERLLRVLPLVLPSSSLPGTYSSSEEGAMVKRSLLPREIFLLKTSLRVIWL